MQIFADVSENEDAVVEALDAYCFGPHEFFVVVQAVDEEEEEEASILLRVPMDDPTAFEQLDEFDAETINYWARDPKTHFIQASGRYLRGVSGGRVSIHQFDQFETALMYMTNTPEGTVVVYGDNGMALRLSGGAFAPLTTNLQENLFAMHVNDAGLAAVGGDYGAFAMGPLDALEPIDPGHGMRITKLRVRDDGSVAMAVMGEQAREYRDGEVVFYNEHDAPWDSIVEFQGEEFWGDRQYGVFVRRGTEFIPVFQTEYAFTMNASASHMVVNSAHSVRIWDGKDWRNFRISGDPEAPVVAAELDFTPNWPV